MALNNLHISFSSFFHCYVIFLQHWVQFWTFMFWLSFFGEVRCSDLGYRLKKLKNLTSDFSSGHKFPLQLWIIQSNLACSRINPTVTFNSGPPIFFRNFEYLYLITSHVPHNCKLCHSSGYEVQSDSHCSPPFYTSAEILIGRYLYSLTANVAICYSLLLSPSVPPSFLYYL